MHVVSLVATNFSDGALLTVAHPLPYGESSQGGSTADEQHHTPATYSAAEARSIREAFAQADARLMCPRCDEELSVSPTVVGHGGMLQEVSCPSCNRCVIMRGLPERPASF
jgi:hypothetical protein